MRSVRTDPCNTATTMADTLQPDWMRVLSRAHTLLPRRDAASGYGMNYYRLFFDGAAFLATALGTGFAGLAADLTTGLATGFGAGLPFALATTLIAIFLTTALATGFGAGFEASFFAGSFGSDYLRTLRWSGLCRKSFLCCRGLGCGLRNWLGRGLGRSLGRNRLMGSRFGGGCLSCRSRGCDGLQRLRWGYGSGCGLRRGGLCSHLFGLGCLLRVWRGNLHRSGDHFGRLPLRGLQIRRRSLRQPASWHDPSRPLRPSSVRAGGGDEPAAAERAARTVRGTP